MFNAPANIFYKATINPYTYQITTIKIVEEELEKG